MTYIVCQVLSNEEQEKVYKTFKAFDLNNDGKITKDELISGYRKFYRDLPEKEILVQVERLFKKGDPDSKGFIGYSEWQMATIDKLLLLQEEKLQMAFNLFDKVLFQF